MNKIHSVIPLLQTMMNNLITHFLIYNLKWQLLEPNIGNLALSTTPAATTIFFKRALFRMLLSYTKSYDE